MAIWDPIFDFGEQLLNNAKDLADDYKDAKNDWDTISDMFKGNSGSDAGGGAAKPGVITVPAPVNWTPILITGGITLAVVAAIILIRRK